MKKKYPDLTTVAPKSLANAVGSLRRILTVSEKRYVERLFKDLRELYDFITGRQYELITSIEEQFNNDGKLSDKQIQTLERIKSQIENYAEQRYYDDNDPY